MGRREGWGVAKVESRSNAIRKTGARERGGGNRGGPTSVKQGSQFKEGFSHYDSATVYGILQRPYYNGLLAFMLPFTSRVQHLHGKQHHDLLQGGLAEDHSTREDDLRRRILFRVSSHKT